jgi:dTDP-4-dehydrorhamnose 3,5-epimerase
MEHKTTEFEDLILIKSRVFEDSRGNFFESYSKKKYAEIGINDLFLQDNKSKSFKNVLRGLHYQHKDPQSQLVTVLEGEIFDVCLDLRKNSKTFGKWISHVLSHEGYNQIYMPPGFAHGYYVLSDSVELHYKVSKYYEPSHESGIIWDDQTLSIDWPCEEPVLSDKDKEFPKFKNDIKVV